MLSVQEAKARISLAAAPPAGHAKTHDGLLFHYTNAEGLHGIFSNRCLWATEFRFLGDTSEYVYGQKLIHDVLVKREDKRSKVLHFMWPDAMRDLSAVTLYVASMCEQGDLLSQWRGYARVGDAYSVGLSKAALQSKGSWELAKVLYSREEQIQLIQGILDEWKLAEDEVHESDRRAIIVHGITTLSTVIASFKDPSFAGEEEWRMFRHTPPEGTIKYRASRGHILPYTEIQLEEGDIRLVTQGPGYFRGANKRAIHDLSHKCGFGHLNVSESVVSLV
jgi:hypothetical protein